MFQNLVNIWTDLNPRQVVSKSDPTNVLVQKLVGIPAAFGTWVRNSTEYESYRQKVMNLIKTIDSLVTVIWKKPKGRRDDKGKLINLHVIGFQDMPQFNF